MNKNESRSPQTFEGISTRELSDQLNALGLDDDDEEDDAMNVSDFLNTRGDLTGLSEWTDSDGEDDELKKRIQRLVSDTGGESDASTASTDSITISMHKRQPANLQPPPEESHLQNYGHVKDTSPSSHMKPKVLHSGPNYGCRVFSGFGLDILKPSDESVWRVLPGAETEQIFIRAPNFRTPGGYKPPLVEKEPRNLTDEEIFQEVKEMYSEQISDAAAEEKDSLEFLILNPLVGRVDEKGDSEVNQELSVEEPKVMKNKTWLCGENGEPITQNSLAQLFTESYKGDISRCLPRNRLSVNSRKENLEELTRLWNEIQETKLRLEEDMSSLAVPLPVTGVASYSVESKEEVNTSPPMLQLTPKAVIPTISDVTPRPRRTVSFGKRPFPAQTVATDELKSTSGAEAQATKSPAKVRPKRWLRKSKGKERAKEFHESIGAADSPNISSRLPFLEPGFGFERSEIEQILHETDMQESDFDDILTKLNDRIPSGMSELKLDLFNDPDSPYELSSELQQLQISDWAKEGAQEYMQKYYEERYRRDHCETEIGKLQKELLEFKEKVAVSQGVLRGKEASINKFSKLWEGLLTQWKSHEKGCKAQTTQLQIENGKLHQELQESKERIKAYEIELEKAIELSGDFKTKVQTTLENLETERNEARKEKGEFECRINSLEAQLTQAQAEKEEGRKALHDCEESLNSTKNSITSTTDEFQRFKSEQKVEKAKFLEFEAQNEKLKSEMIDLLKEKSDLTSNTKMLQAEIEKLKVERVILESAQESDFRRKLKEDRDKLHDYYNTKIKEILNLESQKMILAEKEFVELHEQKLENVEKEAEKRLEEMRIKFTNLVQRQKVKYETELSSLKKENEEQETILGTVSRQLRNYSERDKEGEHNERGDKQTYLNTEQNGRMGVTLETQGQKNSISSLLVEAMSGPREKLDTRKFTNGNHPLL